jgi:hypothetical protein
LILPITAQQMSSRYVARYANSRRLAWDPAAIELVVDE